TCDSRPYTQTNPVHTHTGLGSVDTSSTCGLSWVPFSAVGSTTRHVPFPSPKDGSSAPHPHLTSEASPTGRGLVLRWPSTWLAGVPGGREAGRPPSPRRISPSRLLCYCCCSFVLSVLSVGPHSSHDAAHLCPCPTQMRPLVHAHPGMRTAPQVSIINALCDVPGATSASPAPPETPRASERKRSWTPPHSRGCAPIGPKDRGGALRSPELRGGPLGPSPRSLRPPGSPNPSVRRITGSAVPGRGAAPAAEGVSGARRAWEGLGFVVISLEKSDSQDQEVNAAISFLGSRLRPEESPSLVAFVFLLYQKMYTSEERYNQRTQKRKIYHVCPQKGKKIFIHVREIARLDDQLYQCLDREQNFRENLALIMHQATHTHTFKCLEYEKSFSCSSDLIVHQRIHMEEKPHQWSTCENGFLLGMDFVAQQKMRTQTEELHYKYSVCDKSFHQSSALLQHQTIHLSEKPYICNVVLQTVYISHGTSENPHWGETPAKVWEKTSKRTVTSISISEAILVTICVFVLNVADMEGLLKFATEIFVSEERPCSLCKTKTSIHDRLLQ
ncbi:Zinc finger protein 322, partial [Galemys pyrenaicus]